MDMRDYFKVGDRIGNYCNGYFGRDDYYNKTCVMVTEKYAVFEYDIDEDGYGGSGAVLNREDGLEKCINGENWKPTDNEGNIK